MFMRLTASVAWCAAIVLQFDGSLKRPRDPGFTTQSLGQIAACAASIRDDDGFFALDDATNKPTPTARNHFLGGKRLNVGTLACSSSASSEYEGLLLGLEFLANLLDGVDGSRRAIPQQGEVSPILSVSGDCKMVIDQLNGKSRPRKMETYYLRAQSLVHQISPYFEDIRFKHVPRDQNELCDRLCAHMTLKAQEDAEEALDTCISQLSRHLHKNCGDEHIEIHSPRELMDSHHFRPNESLIPYSKRPFYYERLVELAEAITDYSTTLLIGETLQLEAKSVWSKVSTHHGPSTSSSSDSIAKTAPIWTAASLEAAGIRHQIDGLVGIGKEKEANRLQRKHLVLLQRRFQPEDEIQYHDGENLSSFQPDGTPQVQKLVRQWGKAREKWIATEGQTKPIVDPFWEEMTSQ